MCSCGVLRGVKQDGAPADGDDELHPRLPHPPLGGHGHAFLEASLLDSCLGHSSHPCWMEVSLAKHKKERVQEDVSRLIPESPSWLLVKGRTKEALEQLERVARCNKADLQVKFDFLCRKIFNSFILTGKRDLKRTEQREADGCREPGRQSHSFANVQN